MVIHRLNSATTQFRNVDLDIDSNSDLQPLVTALGKKVIVLYVKRIRRTHSAHLELAKITRAAPRPPPTTQYQPMRAAVLLAALALAADAHPRPPFPPLTRAYAALRARDYDTAIAHFNAAIAAAPRRPSLRKDLAYA